VKKEKEDNNLYPLGDLHNQDGVPNFPCGMGPKFLKLHRAQV
jgi:hypothetical protein